MKQKHLEKSGMRRIKLSISAIAMAVVLGTSSMVPVYAADVSIPATTATQAEHKYTITFNLEGGGSEVFYANEGDTYGPYGTISVRDTYYANGVDYDLSEGEVPADSSPIGSDLTFTYKKHTADTLEFTVNAIVNDVEGNGTILKSITVPVSEAEGSKIVNVPAELGASFENNGFTYTPGQTTVTLTFGSNDSTTVNVPYKKVSDDDVKAYQCTVKYVDDTNQTTLATRYFYVNGKPYKYFAPTVYATTVDGVTTYYKAVNRTETKITNDPNTKAGRDNKEYTVHYVTDTQEAYTWYIFKYSSSTNECIGIDQVSVKPGETQSYTPEDTYTDATGVNYTINSGYKSEYTHEYGNANRSTYIYYDPEGYDTKQSSRNVSIQYVNIANGSLIYSETKQVTSSAPVDVTFPTTYDVEGVHYIKVDGQIESEQLSYYSPRTTYTIYYRDEANTEFETVVITNEQVVETEVLDGNVTYTVVPGITRTIATDTTNGINTIVATNDSTGAPINSTPVGPNAPANENTPEAPEAEVQPEDTDNGQDISIDGVQAEDIQTPQGNIRLNETSNTPILAFALGAILVAAAAALALLLVVRSRKQKQ